MKADPSRFLHPLGDGAWGDTKVSGSHPDPFPSTHESGVSPDPGYVWIVGIHVSNFSRKCFQGIEPLRLIDR